MWMNILISCLLIAITILVHSIATRYVIYFTKKRTDPSKKHFFLTKGYVLSIVVFAMFFASILESTIWAISYVMGGAIEKFSDALYFSIVTFTTLGYGDITLNEHWRILGSFEAAIGIIIFGWSTAIVTAAVQRLYFSSKDH